MANRNVASKACGAERRFSTIVTNALQLYKGDYVGLNTSTGRVVAMADSASIVFLGLVEEQVLGDTSATPPKEAKILAGPIIIRKETVTGVSAQSHVGDPVYATGVQTLTLTPATNVKQIGYVWRWHSSTTCDVLMLSPEAHRVAASFGAVTALTDNSGGAAADGTIGAVTAPTALGATLTDSTGDSGTHDDTVADGSTIGAALTDNSTGSAGDTIAAGAGTYTLVIPCTLPAGTGAEEVVTDYVLGHKFKILSWSFTTAVAGVGAGASRVFNMEIGAVDVGTVASTCTLTEASTSGRGEQTAGTAVSGANTGTAANAFSIEVANGGTAFTAGSGFFTVLLQNMDTADAIASAAAKINTLRTDNLVQNQNDSDITQKVIELVTAQAADRTAIVALTDAVKELATKVNAIITAIGL